MIGHGLHCLQAPETPAARTLERLTVLAPFGVFPPRNGGHLAVLEPLRQMARAGVAVHLFGLGIRRFELGRHWRPFVRTLEPGLREERYVGWWNFLDFARRGRSGLPPIHAADFLRTRLSPTLREEFARSQVTQCESPWLYPLLPADRPRVFMAQNVEADLVDALPGIGAADRRAVAEQEARAWQGADLVMCLTAGDRDGLVRRYGPREAHVMPIGVDCERTRPPTPDERRAARAALGVGDRYVTLFTGSWHLPNRAALRRMAAWAAPSRDVLFVAAGSVCPRATRSHGLWTTGPLPSLAAWWHAADCAILPLEEGSGANVKLLEYLAAGLPVVTTRFGARGLPLVDGEHALVREVDQIPAAVRELAKQPDQAARIASAGRALVEATRSWRTLAQTRRRLLEGVG